MNSRVYYSHSMEGKPPEDWHRLKDHLVHTAALAAEFAKPFGAADWAYLAGLWHDLGKYSRDFQEYLRSQAEASAETEAGRVDHSTAGAQHAVQTVPLLGHLPAYAIAGHHAGLLDGRSEEVCQEKRLGKTVLLWAHGLNELPKCDSLPDLPIFVRDGLGKKDAFTVAFFIRMLFSCLVDADFLDTEQFLNPQKAAKRSVFPTLEQLAPRFFRSLEKLEAQEPGIEINRIRHDVRTSCENAAEYPPGFFSLTVPTGGGKTLSSLAFALKHAQRHGLKRIIYVVPFTTIIEQNADVFRRHLGRDALLEHHCSLDPKKESQAGRLAAENWDAHLIVTTSVQFFDSLFARRTSHCRKLHRIAGSIIILDEAQTMPVDYLSPCLRALDELARNYGCTVVLCTATQPAIRRRSDFKIGLENVREIIPEPRQLYLKLKRVTLKRIGRQTDAELGERLLLESKVLCIVNTTRHARELFGVLGKSEGNFHLSARMCPAHRRLRLWQIRRALRHGKICRVVSTQVVEAGVDLDFPVVYRALAGLDSIAQAAGRCNRNGMLKNGGHTFVFTTEHASAERYFAETANCAAQAMELYSDPLDLEANEHFFRLYFWDQQARWDSRHILDGFHLVQDQKFPFNFAFAKAATDFQVIDDTAYSTVIVPWGREGRALCKRLHVKPAPDREILRQAQRYAVQVHRTAWNPHAGREIRLVYDNLGILECPEIYYDKDTGLNLEAEGPGSLFV